MTLEILSARQKEWKPLPDEGCINVRHKPLLKQDHLALAMLHFGKQATIHKHAADFDVDVVCLEGSGLTSVGKEQAPLFAGDRVRWPAGKQHRLWTTDSEMMTLMVEHIGGEETAVTTPIWEDVDSSMISAFKYDPATKELDVMFNRTGMYRYFDVPQDVIDDFREASSKGSFMRYAIIDMFDYEKSGR
ncbi:MAG: KTSC domain-containing protein [Chloroflexi bacterium]|nr:KTSC domain-containing protein [Chloroflexota bacterium]